MDYPLVQITITLHADIKALASSYLTPDIKKACKIRFHRSTRGPALHTFALSHVYL